MANWLSTGEYLVVSVSGLRPVTIEKRSDNFRKVMDLLISGASDEEIKLALDISSKIESYGEGGFNVDRCSGRVIIDGEEVHNVVTTRIVEFAKKGLPYLPLLNFWRNIQKNPSEESKRHLFLFLEANKMSITDDGCFIAYKGVKKTSSGDFVDEYTGRFCNNVGAVVTMDRDKVNPDRKKTCSSGLHVAAFNYAFSSYNTLIEVKVNPRDVVAVPEDYNNQKMRVCCYEVIAICKGKQRNVDDVPLVEKPVERALRKHSEKSQKNEKKAIRAEQQKNHDELVAVYKNYKHGSDIGNLEQFTVREIVDIIKVLTTEEIIKTYQDFKNKKNILRRAKIALEEHGFKVK